MQTTEEEVLELHIDEVSGGLAVTSPDLPGLILFGYKPEEALGDLLPTVEELVALNRGERVQASVVSAGGRVTELRPGTHRLRLHVLGRAETVSAGAC